MIQHRMLGATTDGPDRDHVLLMQFDSDKGMDWMWCDVGVVQFWIKKADLAALHFDDVIVLTFGG